MADTSRSQEPVEIFYSYAHEDEDLREELEKHLALLQRQGIITQWHDRRITAGREWSGQINEHLNTSRVILLLVSADFVASDYCYDVELKRALARHETGEAIVLPIILKPVDNWQAAPFGKLHALPKDGVPVTTWDNRDEAFADISQGIRRAILSDIRSGPAALRNERGRERSKVHPPSVTIPTTIVFVVFFFLLFQWLRGKTDNFLETSQHGVPISPKIIEAIFAMQSICLARSEFTIEAKAGGSLLALKKGVNVEGSYRETEIPSLLKKLQNEVGLMEEASEIRKCMSPHIDTVLNYILQDKGKN